MVLTLPFRDKLEWEVIEQLDDSMTALTTASPRPSHFSPRYYLGKDTTFYDTTFNEFVDYLNFAKNYLHFIAEHSNENIFLDLTISKKWWMGTWQHRLPWTTEQNHTSESWRPPSETTHQKHSCGIVPTSAAHIWSLNTRQRRWLKRQQGAWHPGNRSRLLSKSNTPLFFQQVLPYYSSH